MRFYANNGNSFRFVDHSFRNVGDLRARLGDRVTKGQILLRISSSAFSHDIGSDSQRSFAIVIVGGLIVELIISIFLLPALYVFWARPGDKFPPPELGFIEEGEHVG